MHTERIRALADLIEQQPHVERGEGDGFNMEYWNHPCGSPCCIGGWANHIAKDPSGPEGAAHWLDLNQEQAERLFTPDMYHNDDAPKWHLITPSQAAAVLRHLADHGVVDWTVGVSV